MSDGSERRRDPRISCQARVLWKGPAGTKINQARDVSRRGLYVLAKSPPEMGSEIQLQVLRAGALDGPRDRAQVVVTGTGRVVWSQPGQGMGVEFLDMELTQEQLTRLTARATSQRPPPQDEQEAPAPRARQAPRESPRKVRRPKPAGQIDARGSAVQGSDTQGYTIGIDLGTSNTCASVVMAGKPQVIPTRYGTNTIPSVVSFDKKGRVQVGQDAVRGMVLRPTATIYGSKRLLGRSYRDDWKKEFQPRFAYPIVESPNHTFGAQLDGRTVTMEDVARQLLQEVKLVAEQRLGTRVENAVVTVPAYYSEVQRDAVREAAAACGLKVRRVVQEPTAAAVAYGFNRESKGRLAVFDLGGGTFDISVLELDGNDFTAVGTDGDNFLGGTDFDDVIAMHLLQRFRQGIEGDFIASPQHVARVKQEAEQAKQLLSVQDRVDVMIPQFASIKGKQLDLQVSITRAEFEQAAEPRVQRIMKICKNLFADLVISPKHDIDEVLLVGGSTRIPMVQAAAERFFGKRANRRVNPDEAVALGAAILADQDDEDEVRLVDVLPLSIGMAGEGRKFIRLLKRNIKVPVKRSFTVRTTQDDQPTIAVPLFQGERDDVARNEYLGTVVVENLPMGEAGSHSYELILALDPQCVLNVYVRNEQTRKFVEAFIERRAVKDVLGELGDYTGKQQAPDPSSTEQDGLFGKVKGMFGGRRG